MSVNQNGNLRPDGFAVTFTPSVPGVFVAGVSVNVYWNPGSNTAPSFTVTRIGGFGAQICQIGPGIGSGLIFLRQGTTSADTLGYGTTTIVSTVVPSMFQCDESDQRARRFRATSEINM